MVLLHCTECLQWFLLMLSIVNSQCLGKAEAPVWDSGVNNIPSICGVKQNVLHFWKVQWILFDFDKWLSNDHVMMGSQALGVSLHC